MCKSDEKSQSSRNDWCRVRVGGGGGGDSDRWWTNTNPSQAEAVCEAAEKGRVKTIMTDKESRLRDQENWRVWVWP